MRNIATMIRKEVRIYFTTPVAYVVITVFAIISGFFFIRLLEGFQQTIAINSQMQPQMLKYLNFTDQVLTHLFFNIGKIMVFVVPFLTMRLLAEERKAGTYELLMTNPIMSALLNVVLDGAAIMLLPLLMDRKAWKRR